MSDRRVAFGRDHTAGAQVVAALDAVRPIIRVPAGLGPAGATVAAALVGIVGRLFPHVIVDGDASLGPNPWGAETVAAAHAAFAASRPPPTGLPTVDVGLGIGAVEGDLVLGGDDWTTRVGAGPQPVADGPLGLGLQAGAAWASAELVKRVLGPLGLSQHAAPDGIVWNLLDYQTKPAVVPAVGVSRPVRLALFGGGSVGSSTAALLSCARGVTGTADVVDGDDIDPRKNPFRYPALTGAETGTKAAWLVTMLQRAGWDATPYPTTVASWVNARSTPGFDGIVVSSVDGVDARFDVADVLAGTTISVGVAGLALHVQREHLGDDYACPHCEYVDATPPLGQTQVWAGQTGLAPERVAQLHVTDGRLEQRDLDAAVQAGKLAPNRVSDLLGRRLVDLVGRVYADAAVRTSDGDQAVVSAPYVSWMGGVLAAAEVAKAAFGLPLVDRRADLDLSGVPPGYQYRRDRDRSGRCACDSAIRRRWMHKLYGAA